MFTLINTCVIVKNSMKHHHLKTREYHDLHVQISTSLLADLFENFQYMCLEISELDPTHFLSSMFGMTSSIKKKDQSKSRPFNWYEYVINDRKRYQSRNMSHNSLI